VQYLDVKLKPNGTFTHALDDTSNVFVYVFEGDADIDRRALPQHTFAVLGKGDTVQVSAGENGARFIVVAGRPLNEPIVQYGPFVMSSQQEIQQAFSDYREGKLVREKAQFNEVST
jgi:redox-sensitive bicupin YhaK (pirin superfamily)